MPAVKLTKIYVWGKKGNGVSWIIGRDNTYTYVCLYLYVLVNDKYRKRLAIFEMPGNRKWIASKKCLFISILVKEGIQKKIMEFDL